METDFLSYAMGCVSVWVSVLSKRVCVSVNVCWYVWLRAEKDVCGPRCACMDMCVPVCVSVCVHTYGWRVVRELEGGFLFLFTSLWILLSYPLLTLK